MAVAAAALVATLLLGAAAGALGMKTMAHGERQALLPPVAINAMADGSLVAVKGKVVEMFGGKFIVADSSGRALIDTGPFENGKPLVAPDEDVTVQGRFDDGFVQAGLVIHADGRVDELRPPHGRPHPPKPDHRHEDRDAGPADGDAPPAL